jgi:cytoskeletal protein RodZ
MKLGMDTCTEPEKAVTYPLLMKTVGKQLEEARLARNWTPEMASRETKIKVERVKDLETDDYSHFNNATYARGFVRTYARALGLDEYKILRQLDNKLPDDDSANIVSHEGGVAYLPETAMPPRVAHRDFTGLYVVLGLGGVVMLVIAFVLFRAYQVGELGKWAGEEPTANTTNNAPAVADESPKKALPIDSNTPPPTPTEEPATNAVAAVAPADDGTANAPKAQPVDLNNPNAPVAAPVTPVATPPMDAPSAAPKALPVDPATLNADSGTPSPAKHDAPKALPVDPAMLNTGSVAPVPAAPKALPVDPSTLTAANTTTPSAPRALPVNPADLGSDDASATGVSASKGPVVMPPSTGPNKPLVLTASRDAFVRVTTLDTGSGGKQVYAEVLHSGQSVAFNGHKFSVNVDNPSVVNIKLDGVNYGPHDDGTDPETFTVISHVQ